VDEAIQSDSASTAAPTSQLPTASEPTMASRTWAAVISESKWTEEQALVRFETTLSEFHSSCGKASLYDVPWPCSDKHVSSVIHHSGRQKTTEQFFDYARKARTREQLLQLLQQTADSFRPETWLEKSILSFYDEVLASKVAQQAEIVGNTVARLLKNLQNDS